MSTTDTTPSQHQQMNGTVINIVQQPVTSSSTTQQQTPETRTVSYNLKTISPIVFGECNITKSFVISFKINIQPFLF